jgi:Ca2+-binding RTX toxin-like protein
LLFYPSDSGPPIRINQKSTWTPSQGSGLTVVGAFASAGEYVRNGNMITINGYVEGSTSVACAAGGILTSSLPFAPDGSVVAFYTGTAANSAITSGSQILVTSNINTVGAITAASRIYFTATYFIVLV